MWLSFEKHMKRGLNKRQGSDRWLKEIFETLAFHGSLAALWLISCLRITVMKFLSPDFSFYFCFSFLSLFRIDGSQGFWVISACELGIEWSVIRGKSQHVHWLFRCFSAVFGLIKYSAHSFFFPQISPSFKVCGVGQTKLYCGVGQTKLYFFAFRITLTSFWKRA